MMDYAISIRPILDMLSHGNTMRNVMGRFVQVMAAVMGLTLLLVWIGLWNTIGSLGAGAAMALTFTQIVLLAAFAKLVQVIWVRGEDIRNLEESDFTMMSVFATLVRLPGEVAFIFFALFSIPAMLLVWTGATHVVTMFFVPILAEHFLIAGALTFVTCWIVGFAAWVCFSLAAELVSAVFSIAHDLRCTRKSLESGSQPHSTPSHVRAA